MGSSIVPNTVADKISFYENHTTPWSANAVAIGTTTTAVSDLTTKTTAARAAFNAQSAAQDVAKAATLALKMAVDAMATTGASIITQIRSKASTAGDSVYTLAQIPAPATPSPVPAPGTPTDFKVTLQNNGAITLIWKCANPPGSSGTTYQVWRRLAGTDDLAFLGVTGIKQFVDSSVPAGTVQATYQVQAFRSTLAGPWAQFNVNFTTDIGGTVTAAEVQTAAKKAA